MLNDIPLPFPRDVFKNPRLELPDVGFAACDAYIFTLDDCQG